MVEERTESTPEPDDALAALESGDAVRILVVEDDTDDMESVLDQLKAGMRLPYEVRQAGFLREALEIIRAERVDIVLLDLGLPDTGPGKTIQRVRAERHDLAIVVVTGEKEHQQDFAARCFSAGAQDLLYKEELTPELLGRAIGFSLFRVREGQMSELRRNLRHYRQLSSEASGTTTTGRMVGLGPLSARAPLLFQTLLDEYRGITKAYMRYLAVRRDKPEHAMERLVTQVGDQFGGPRDLMDLHVAVINEATSHATGEIGRSMVFEGRLLALEMMGLLLNYYRTGSRRT